jgi:hypothetical protein
MTKEEFDKVCASETEDEMLERIARRARRLVEELAPEHFDQQNQTFIVLFTAAVAMGKAIQVSTGDLKLAGELARICESKVGLAGCFSSEPSSMN